MYTAIQKFNSYFYIVRNNYRTYLSIFSFHVSPLVKGLTLLLNLSQKTIYIVHFINCVFCYFYNAMCLHLAFTIASKFYAVCKYFPCFCKKINA